MSDLVERFFNRIGITGSDAKAFQFVIGIALVAFSLVKYDTGSYRFFYIIAILLGAYFILKAIK